MSKNLYQRPFFHAYFKLSMYNVVVSLDDRGWGVYNSLSGARVCISSDVLSRRQANELESASWNLDVPLPDQETCLALAKLGFFVPHDTDEYAIAASRGASVGLDDKVRRVTVILTRACNVGCTYCYQDKSEKSAVDDVALISQFLRKNVVKGGMLQVTWFGGEPLLRMKIIRELSLVALEECERVGGEFRATMSTNGVRFTKLLIDELVALNLKSVQISLDGPLHVHERRRPALNGLSTYERIMTNIAEALEAGIEVTIKVIVDRQNAHSVPDLFNDLSARGLLNRLNIAIQETEAKFAAATYGERYRSAEEFASVKLNLLQHLAQAGYALREPAQKPEFCAATSPYSQIIDMSGRSYRCGTEQVNLTGKLRAGGELEIENTAYEHLFTGHEYGCLPDCRTCKALPVCGGGCTLAAKGLAEREVCSFYRYELKGYLLLLEGKFHTVPAL